MNAEQTCRQAFKWFDTLTPQAQSVLIEMCLNVGLKRLLGFGQTLKALREHRYGDAADRLAHTRWGRQYGGTLVERLRS